MNYQLYFSNVFLGIFSGADENEALNSFAQAYGKAHFKALCDSDSRYTRKDARLVALKALNTLDSQPAGTYVEIIKHETDGDTLYYIGPFDHESHAQSYMGMLTSDTLACIVNHEGN